MSRPSSPNAKSIVRSTAALAAFTASTLGAIVALAQTPPPAFPFPTSTPTATPPVVPVPPPLAPGAHPTTIRIPKRPNAAPGTPSTPVPQANPAAPPAPFPTLPQLTPFPQPPPAPTGKPAPGPYAQGPYQPYPPAQPNPGQRGPYPQQQPNSQYYPYGGGPQGPYAQGPYGGRQQGPYQQMPPRRSSSSSSRLSSDETLEKRGLRGTFTGNVLGFGVTSTSTQRSGDGSRDALSFGLVSNYDLVGSSNGMGGSARVHWRGALGGGGAGFDGRYESLFTIGPVIGTEQVGIAPRIGLGGNIRGNDRYYRANIALPRGDLALDIHPIEGLFLEGGITGAYNLVGRFNIEDTSRKTGEAWQAGFFGVAAISILSGTVQGTREYVRGGPGTPIDTLEINGCLNPISALVLCANYVNSRGEARVAREIVPVGLQTLGGSLGFGAVGTR